MMVSNKNSETWVTNLRAHFRDPVERPLQIFGYATGNLAHWLIFAIVLFCIL